MVLRKFIKKKKQKVRFILFNLILDLDCNEIPHIYHILKILKFKCFTILVSVKDIDKDYLWRYLIYSYFDNCNFYNFLFIY